MSHASNLPGEALQVLEFWFEKLKPEQWWVKDDGVDAEIKRQFGELYSCVSRQVPSDWLETPEGCLAAVIVLDQFPRNMFRNDALSYESDAKALALASETVAKGWDMKLDPHRRQFLYMPYQHSEVLEDQIKSVELFRALGNEDNLDFAIKHKDIVERFGRFPHRNEILGRKSTPEELEFLKAPGLFW